MTSAARLATTPDLPTASEFLPGFKVTAWFGIDAPRYTPAEIVKKRQVIRAARGSGKAKANATQRAACSATSMAGLPRVRYGRLEEREALLDELEARS